MKVTGDWLTHPATQSVMAMLNDAGHQAFVVGGCVRNALLGVPVSDIDIATDARPEQVMKLAEARGLKVIPTGLQHGTVTVVAKKIPHEITTFRRDVATDGRHAQVAFSGSISADATRRDFTMNALYADANGAVSDLVGGLPDIDARLVRFIGDADGRITEDYLRILRFFRFHAWYGDQDQGLDAESLAACAAHTDGLDQLSGERIGAEMRKLLSAPDPVRSVAAMAQSGVLMRVMPGAETGPLGPLQHFEIAPSPWQVRAAVMGGDDVADRWRLSKPDTRELAKLRDLIADPMPLPEIAYRHDAATAHRVNLLRAATFEQSPKAADQAIQTAAQSTFPIKAKHLMPEYEGEALGVKLAALKADWIASGFTLTRDDLLK